MTRVAWLVAVVPLACAGTRGENHPPVIDPIAPQTINVGDTLRVAITARDPDGDPLRFTVTPSPVGSRFEVVGDHVEWVWAPLISDTATKGKRHYFRLRAEDEDGAEAARAIEVNVLPASGAPVFVGPNGHILNLARDDDLAFVISVKDDDSVEETFTTLTAIPGAEIEPIDTKTLSFYWKPTEAQIAESDFWPLVISVKDESHPEVLESFSVLLVNAGVKRACAGSPPVISHRVLEDQKGTSVLVFKVYVDDDESDARDVLLRWTSGDPAAPGAFDTAPIEMERCDPVEDPECPDNPLVRGDQYFLASLPAATILQAGDAPAALHYAIEATDDDDVKATSCDHRVRYPKTGWLTTWVYPAKDAPCQDDAAEPDDTLDTAQPLGQAIARDRRFCVGFAEADWIKVDVTADTTLSVALLPDVSREPLQLTVLDASGTALTTPGGHVSLQPSGSPVYIKVDAPEGTIPKDQGYGLVTTLVVGGCPNDAAEPNDGPGPATLWPNDAVDSRKVVICHGDEDWFRFTLPSDHTAVATLEFDHVLGDLDLLAYDPATGERIGASTSATSGESLRVPAEGTQEVALAVLGYEGAANAGKLTVSIVPTKTLCYADRFTPNGTAAQAVLLPEGPYETLTACTGAADWFRVEANAGETLVIDSFPRVEGEPAPELTAYLDPDSGKEVGTKSVDKGVVTLKVPIEEAGMVTWKLSNSTGATSLYDFQFFIDDAAGPCVDDRFTGNATAKTALEVDATQGFVTRLKLCPGDEDWFRLDAHAFEEFYVFVYGFTSEPLLAAELYRQTKEGQLEVVVTGLSTSNGVELRTLPEANEPLFVHVHPAVPGENVHHYDLVFGQQ